MFPKPTSPQIVAFVLLTLLALVSACSSTPSPQVALATASPTPTVRPTPTPRPTPVPTPTPIPLDQALLKGRVTLLIVGTDSNVERARRGVDVNTDALIVASVNAKKNRIVMLSLPRDTVDLPMADGGVWRNKINGLERVLGIKALRDTIATTLGVPIPYYLQLDMADLGRITTAVGGLDIVVPYALYDPSIGLDMSAGKHHMGANDVARYVRSRHQDSDYGRARRQQQVVMALVGKLLDPHTKIDLRKFLMGFASVRTNVPIAKLATFREIARRSVHAPVTSTVLGPPRFVFFQGEEPNSTRGWVIIPNVAEIRAYAQSVMGDK
jgi:polyisoprenyl-teichoic acid--peptidoglycan teichoic acid transferase